MDNSRNVQYPPKSVFLQLRLILCYLAAAGVIGGFLAYFGGAR